jgi:hypothetical protein
MVAKLLLAHHVQQSKLDRLQQPILSVHWLGHPPTLSVVHLLLPVLRPG